MTPHQFQPHERVTDCCDHRDGRGILCGHERAHAMHNVLEVQLSVSEKLARLLDVPIEVLERELRAMVIAAERPRRQLAFSEPGNRRTEIRLGCRATIGDDDHCERAAGHEGLHCFIGRVWNGDQTRVHRARCAAVYSKPLIEPLGGSVRCILETDHESDAHELDCGLVWR